MKPLGVRRSCLSLSYAVVLTLLSAALGTGCRGQQSADAATPPPAAQPARSGAVGCLGRIEAGDGIVRVAARSLSGQASIVSRLLVKEGDAIRAGQVVAELDSKPQLDAAVTQAAARVEVARRRLAQVQAGAKPSDIAAQQAEVDRLQNELTVYDKELQRHASLGENVTASELDSLKLRVQSTTQALAAAKQRLTSLGEVRPVDVELARAELQEAIGNEARARAEDTASVIRSPADGRVLKVHARPGEIVGADGVLELAPVEPMYAIAEVPESDIARVRVGQRATISGAALAAPVQGTVERIAAKVLQNQLMPVDPANFSDARVVEVWVRVADGAAVANLIHLRVNVVIEP
jgi:HlyD family secretion protein